MKNFLKIAISIFLLNCESNTIFKKPKGLIPKEKMVEIFTDSYIAREAVNYRNINGDRNINYLRFIYKNQGIDSISFNESLKYYISDDVDYIAILNTVKDNIRKKLKDLEQEKLEKK